MVLYSVTELHNVCVRLKKIYRSVRGSLTYIFVGQCTVREQTKQI